MSDTVCLIIRKPPVGSTDSLEALRLSLGIYSADVEPAIVLIEDGVFNAVRGIDESRAIRPATNPYVEEVVDCDIPIHVVEEDAHERGLGPADFNEFVQFVSRRQLGALIGAHRTVFAF